MALRELTPIGKCDKVKLPPIFAVADIESNNWIEFLTVGYYIKLGDMEVFKHFECLRQFIYFLFSHGNPSNDIFCHNAEFDVKFFNQTIMDMEEFQLDSITTRGSLTLSSSVSEIAQTSDRKTIKSLRKKQIVKEENGVVTYRVRTINFRDSLAFLPFKLESLTENFKVEHKKQKIDHTKTKKVDQKLIEYLEYDCKGLFQVIIKYRDWPIIKKAGVKSTMASQALQVFRTFLKSEIRGLVSGPGTIDEFVRKSYFGGRTEIFKPIFEGSKTNMISCMDVNSLYPTVMLQHDYPTNFKMMTSRYYPDQPAFYDAEVFVPHDMYIPPLATNQQIGKNKKLIFPTGRFSGTWSTVELEYARSLGVKIIKTGEGALFENGGRIFKSYIETLYKIRMKAEKGSVDDILAKLLMNSCYGRFGMDINKEQIIEDDGSLDLKEFTEYVSPGGKLKRLMYKPVTLDKTFTNVAIAAWTTSLARIHMHKIYMQNPENNYYTDTDSVFTSNKMKTGSGLGELKLEYNLINACFLLPKTYVVDYWDSKKGEFAKKLVMKGFRYDDIAHLSRADFMESFVGEAGRIKVKTKARMAPLRTALNRGGFLVMIAESERQLRSKYDKRRIIKTQSGYDTEPLVIKDNMVINLV